MNVWNYCSWRELIVFLLKSSLKELILICAHKKCGWIFHSLLFLIISQVWVQLYKCIPNLPHFPLLMILNIPSIDKKCCRKSSSSTTLRGFLLQLIHWCSKLTVSRYPCIIMRMKVAAHLWPSPIFEDVLLHYWIALPHKPVKQLYFDTLHLKHIGREQPQQAVHVASFPEVHRIKCDYFDRLS